MMLAYYKQGGDMSYSKQGVNYGIGQLTVEKIESDLTFLRQHFDYIRITYPAFNSTSIDYWKDICVRAKAKGFYVMWGIYCPQNATADWYKFLQAFIDLSAWAASKGVVFGFNEDAYHNDDAILVDDLALRDMHQAAKLAKLKTPNVKLAISLAGDGELDKFIQVSGPYNTGRAAFDFVCLNQYGMLSEHQASVTKLSTNYGINTRVTEFNTGRGFDPGYGDEVSWYNDVKTRADAIQASQVAAFYLYTYDHNPEENGKWNFRTGQNPETQRQAFELFRR